MDTPSQRDMPSQMDMSAWLSWYKMMPLALVGVAVLSPWRELSPHEIVDLVGDSPPETTPIVQSDHSPIHELVLSPRQEEELIPSPLHEEPFQSPHKDGVPASSRVEGDRELE